jgi:hydroxymethylpyrimidine pyrophosphatase-like HAD family hydrolase
LQSEYKISCYGNNLDERFLTNLRQQFADLGRAVEIVYSSERDLDILPAGTNKGTAVAHLAKHWQIDPSRVIIAGDSGNDARMFGCGFCGIVVGNAKPELQALDDANAYRASGTFAAGVLEGLDFWLSNDRLAVFTAGRSTADQGSDRGMRG